MRKNISPDYSVQGDEENGLKEILPKLKEQKASWVWWEEILSMASKTKSKGRRRFPSCYYLGVILRSMPEDDTVVATDVGQHQMNIIHSTIV